MIQHQGVWLPDGEKHLIEWMDSSGEIVDGKGTYQIKKLRAALSYCESFRMAVDVGGHCGLWSMQLRKEFQTVCAFEPVKEHRRCFEINMDGWLASEPTESGVHLFSCALGDHEGAVSIRTNPTSSGDSVVNGDGDIPMRTLDSFGFEGVDFIKIDCEGYELFVIRGAEETIKRCKPIMVVEQKGHGMKHFGIGKEDAVDLLKSWGMRPMRAPMSGDHILGW